MPGHGSSVFLRSTWLATLLLFAVPGLVIAATYQITANAPYHWESAVTDVVWERNSTSSPVDDDKQLVNIGFSFPFGGSSYSQVRILSNGILQFGADQNLHRDSRNAALPYTGGDRAIYVYWDDLDPSRGGSVRYSLHGSAPHRYFVVSWENLPNDSYTGVYSLQVVLYENGEIKTQYGNGDATGDSATIGIQVSPSDYTQYSFDTPNAVDGSTAIVFYQPRPHFALGVPGNVNLCGGSAINVTVTRHNADHSVDTGFTGEVVLSATGSGGRWSNLSGTGSFRALGNGTARYTFTAADQGQVVLQYGYTNPVVTNFHVDDGSVTEHHAEDPYLTFQYGLTETAADDFETGDYLGSVGTLSWATDWIEVKEQDGPAAGDIRIVQDGGDYVLRLQDNERGGEGAYREIDLSGYPSGTLVSLSFDYRRDGMDDANDYVALDVSGNHGQSWRELDRFTGPGTDSAYQSASYDITGFVATSARIRFMTSQHLGSTDRLYVDNVAITVRTPVCGIDHYAISHGGIGVTCEASAITISGHDSAHAQAEPGAGTQVTVTAIDTASGTVAADASWSYTGTGSFNVLGGGRASYTFGAGETGVQLWLSRPAGGNVNINVLDANGAFETPLEDPDLAFLASALRFYADGVADAIGPQIAGKSAGLSPGAQTLSVRAVETNTETGVCQSRLTGTRSVEFAYECVDPSSCVAGQGAQVAGVAVPGNAAGSVVSYQPVTLTFDANGYAPFDFLYSDVGRLVLHARANLPASAQQPAAVVGGASNPFVVAPAGLCVAAPDPIASCPSADANCSVFVKAGQPFDLNLRAVAWESAGESDADFCSGNATTPNFRLGGITLAPQLVAPAAGLAGSLGVGSIGLTAADSGSALFTQTYAEVGVMRITATPPVYLGVPLAPSTSDYVGRFVPDHFALASGALTAACNGFTYMDQPALGLDYQVEARNAAGDRTQNYRDAFAKASVALVAENADDGNDLGSRLSGPGASWTAGLYAVSTANAVFARATAVDGPFDSLQIGVQVNDNDGGLSALMAPDMHAAGSGDCVLLGNCDGATVGTTGVHYGRLNLLNAHGSELQDLAVPLRVEYYEGSATGFVVSGTDSCSTLGGLSILEVDPGDGLVPTETCVWDSLNLSGVGCALPGPPALQYGNTPVAGLFNLNLAAPGAGNTGVVNLQADAPVWLEFDWTGSGPGDPRSRATFGIFNRGTDFIYRRELR